MTADNDAPIDAVLEHMRECRGATAAVVFDRGLSADDTIAAMLAAGWSWGEGTAEASTELIGGKRIRYLIPPAPTPAPNETGSPDAP